MSLWLLMKRNLRIYFRDRSLVFFSLLAAVILVGLYVLFLGKLQVDSLAAENIPGATRDELQAFIDAWVFAGITSITAFVSGLASFSAYVEDATTGRLNDFLVSPIKRSKLTLAYMLSGFIISVIMALIIIIAFQVYTTVQGRPPMGVAQLLQAIAYTSLSAAAFSAISALLATFMKTTSAFSAMNTVVGTAIGFVAGVYLPVGMLPGSVVNVMNALPFAQSAMLIRQPFTEQSLTAIAGPDAGARDSLMESFGITASIGDFEVTSPIAMGMLVLVFIAAAALAVSRISRRLR